MQRYLNNENSLVYIQYMHQNVQKDCAELFFPGLAYISAAASMPDTYLIMELAVDGLSLSIDKLEGMGAIPIHVPIPIWDTTV